jgi:hypothetical protein
VKTPLRIILKESKFLNRFTANEALLLNEHFVVMTKHKYRMNWMSIIGLCLLIAGTVITYLGSVASDRNINSLQNEVGNLKDYSYYATLDIFGRQFVVNNG